VTKVVVVVVMMMAVMNFILLLLLFGPHLIVIRSTKKPLKENQDSQRYMGLPYFLM
jgi:hypothetical protein